jgi:cob(I)alamin adenosyltransferase
MTRKGLICVNTGPGKGKTTAALGTALRAAGQGLRVLILQFMKGRSDVGEVNALGQCDLAIEIRQFGRPVFFKSRACEAIDIHKANQGLEAFKSAMESRTYDMIVLDEINMAIDFGLLKAETVLGLLAQKPSDLHIILTGRNAPRELVEMADMVTEMTEVKHHYNDGIQAQKGIEF